MSSPTSTPGRFIAFLKGINVGGHRAGKEQLIRAFESAGCEQVDTFLASGNVSFAVPGDEGPERRDDVETRLEAALLSELGYDAPTFVRTREEVAAVADTRPFPGVDATTGTLQVGFMRAELPGDAEERVRALCSDVDLLRSIGRELYWYTTGGMMDSPLGRGPALGRALGQDVTMRNANTVRRLAVRYPV